MVEELIPFLPQQLTVAWSAVCVVGIGVGLLLWLLGGVWSRGILTLIAVTGGAALGMLLPRWYIWPINSMALATLGAVGLGVFAFAVPRIWVGLLLGIVLGLWVSFGAWANLHADAPFPWPNQAQVETLSAPELAQTIWQGLPGEVRRVMPFGAATGLISGLSIALLWRKLARAICFSLCGVTGFFVCGLVLVAVRRPDWLDLIPAQAGVQMAVLGVMTLAGVVVQWQLIPSKRSPAAHESTTEGSEPAADQASGSGGPTLSFP
jgi:hypothetical protein